VHLRRDNTSIVIRPLALTGEGLHFARVKTIPAILFCALLGAAILTQPAWAQTEEASPELETPERDQDRSRIIIEPNSPLITPDGPRPVPSLPPPGGVLPAPDLPPDASDLPDPDQSIPEAPMPAIDAPDYSRLSSNEERAARLDDMFSRLSEAQDAEAANLIAEEIWAVWLNSGSASINLLLRRGAESQTRGGNVLARVMYDHVTSLQPDYAEGWARSSRLALEERDFARAAGEAVKALTLEPRHFYALWTLGNVLERLGRQEDALEAYREASRLYPALESVSERVEALELTLDGGVL